MYNVSLKREHYAAIDSTSSEIRRRINEDRAEAGLVITASYQSGGRGRTGKGFESAKNKGLYMSVLLEPAATEAIELSRITTWAAAVCCYALKQKYNLSIGIKWVNDLIVDDRKLGGILCEYVPHTDRAGRLHNYIIIGTGINVLQDASDFSPDIAGMATSLKLAGAKDISVEKTGELILDALSAMYRDFPEKESEYFYLYKNSCVTTGKEVYILKKDNGKRAFARRLNRDYSLNVVYEDGHSEDINSGEVSVRGIGDYV